LLAEHPDIKAVLRAHVEEPIGVANKVLHQAQLDSNAEFIFLMDGTGTTIAASNYRDEVSFIGRNYSFRPYFTGALKKEETTFFAVGATTGIPGYFVANPVMHEGAVIGVVVVKFELAGLLDSWRVEPYRWVATDELGVVILSTTDELLYAPTRALSVEENAKIETQRNYTLTDTVVELRGNTALVKSALGESILLLQSQDAGVERWQLMLLLENSHLWRRALLYVLACIALLAIIGLFYRNLRAQQRLADSEKRYAMTLEQEVELRTEELRSAQESLISESNFAMLGRMSAAINHEINQPLASMRLNLATLRELTASQDVDIAEVRQIAIDTDRTTKRIGRVVTTLRNLTGSKRTVHSELSVSSMINDVVETVKRERPMMSACLSVTLSDEVQKLTGNEVLLQQALLNLLYNAFDAVIECPEPCVELGVAAVEGSVNFAVTDNGCGVSEAVADSLFKPFVTDETKKSGLGLGLTLVELISKDHGGKFGYRPATEHSGSVFTLSVPV